MSQAKAKLNGETKGKVQVVTPIIVEREHESERADEVRHFKFNFRSRNALKQCQDRLALMSDEALSMHDERARQERDSLEIMASIHRQQEAKDVEIKALNDAMAELKVDCSAQIATLCREQERKTKLVLATLDEKNAAMKLMQDEFASIKDFRRKRQVGHNSS